MIPVRLQLHNFMSYKDVTIDLSEIEIAAIVGPNGSGKSTLLQAITYALWGQVRTSSHDDIVRRGAGECAVMLDFCLESYVHRVVRRRKLGGRGSSDLEFYTLFSDDNHEVLTQPTIKETQDMINTTIGMGYDVFASSALLQQGEASRFSDARPAQRKELLANMLGLGWFQELEQRARAHLKKLEADKSRLAVFIENYDNELATLGDLVEVDDLRGSIEELERKIQVNENEAEREQVALSYINSLRSEMEVLLEKQSALIRRINELEEEEGDLIAEANSLSNWELRHDDLLSEKAKLDQLKKQDDNLTEPAREYTTLLAESIDVESLAHDYSNAYDMLQTKMASAEILQDEIDKHVHSHNVLITQYEELKEKCSELKSQLARHEEVYKALKEKQRLFEFESVCPTCGQHIDDSEGHILAEITQEMETVEALIWQTRTDLSEGQVESDNLFDSSQEEGVRLGILNNTMMDLKQDIASLNAKLGHLGPVVDKKKFAASKLEKLVYNPKSHTEIKDKIKSLEHVDTEIAKMEAALERLESVDGKLETTQDKLEKTTSELAEVDSKALQLQEKIRKHINPDDIERTILLIKKNIAELWDHVTQLKIELADANTKNRRIKELRSKLENSKTDFELTDIDIQTASVVTLVAGKTGAQALIIESVLPQIEKDTNEYLASMSNGMRILLESQKTSKSGNVSESLDVIVFADGMKAPIESLSGGERFRADLSLRLAIGKMLARRFGASVKMLAIDEGFGSLDGDGQESVLQVISSLAEFFDLILVISHVPSVAEAIGMAGNVITISRSGGQSAVKVL